MDATEIYVLCESRSVALAHRFLNGCLPDRQPVADEYPFPELADDPSITYQSVDELLHRLEQEPEEEYSIYWNSKDSGRPQQAMLFYTEDGAMIAGIGGPSEPLSHSMESIAKLVNGRFGYVTSGSCPPESQEEFMQTCRESSLVNLFEGQLRIPPACPEN